MADRSALVHEQIKGVLFELTEDERRLLSEVIKIERDSMHQRNPQKSVLNKPLLAAVREVIK